MRKTGLILLLACCFLYIHAEEVVLNSGKHIQGTIVLQNSEVVILRDNDGMRHQYPASDVAEVIADSVLEAMSTAEEVLTETRTNSWKKTSLRLELHGGGTYIPNYSWGGLAGADLLIGSRRIADKPILLGGAIGYRGMIMNQNVYSFIPLSIALRWSIIDSQHAPELGVNIGYGIAVGKQYKGGLIADLHAGYHYTMANGTGFIIGMRIGFQQATIPSTIYFTPQIEQATDPDQYQESVGKEMVQIGAYLSIQL